MPDTYPAAKTAATYLTRKAPAFQKTKIMQLLSGRILMMIGITIFCCSVSAQRNITGVELGAGAAVFVYQGDLTPKRTGSYRNLKPGVVLSVARIVSSSFAIRFNLSAGSLRGDETKYENPEYRKFRAFTFRSPVLELSPQLVWNLRGKNVAVKGLSPYIFGGAAVNFFRIQRDYSGYDPVYFGDGSDIPQRIAADEQQRLPRVRLAIPVGAGMRYNISNSFAVNAETAYRFLSTDYLDGFSQAANPERNDHYQTISAGLIYRWGNVKKGKNQLGCPVMKF